MEAYFSQKIFLPKFLFSPIIKSFVFSQKLETLIHTSLISGRSENQSVSEVFVTKIENPGGSSLTKVLTQDCLNLLSRALLNSAELNRALLNIALLNSALLNSAVNHSCMQHCAELNYPVVSCVVLNYAIIN